MTDLLADLLALTGLATLDGLTAQGDVGCDQLLCNDVSCTTCSRRAWTPRAFPRSAATGTVAGATLSSTGAVSGSLLSITGAASVGLLSGHRNHGQHIDHQQHGQRRELHHGGRRVHGDIDGLRRSDRGKLRSHGAVAGATLTITGAASAGPTARGLPSRPQAVECSAALCVQHAHRDQHL